MKKTVKTSDQNMDEHPAVVVTATTGKAAINVNDITFHYAFGLPVREGLIFTHLAENKEGNFQKIHVNLKEPFLQDINDLKNLLSMMRI